MVFLEQGGIFAQPCLRGGGEFGEEWHKAGMKLNKTNVLMILSQLQIPGKRQIHQPWQAGHKRTIEWRTACRGRNVAKA